MTDELRPRVLEVYAAADAAVAAAAPRCAASGRCCRFAEYGHTLFLSHFEAELLLETAPPYEKPVSRDGCPFQVDNLCTARRERPLGCRIYFCDPAYQETARRITEDALGRLKRLADEFGTGWRYAPLHVFLNEADRPHTCPADIMTSDGRISLPLASRAPDMPRPLAALTLAVSLSLPAVAADWPQFLGPNRDSGSAETVAPWTDSPKVIWRHPVGEAHSSPVVADGVVYAFFKPKDKDADTLAAFDAATGKPKWEQGYDRAKFTPPFGAGPRGTPAVAGGKVYTLGNTGILTAWDAKTGERAWQVDTLQEFNAKNLFFGVSTSPTVVGGQVVVMVGGKGAGVVAFDAASGKVAWQATDDPASYASPLPVGDRLVFLTGTHLRALSAAGKELWAFPFKDQLNESSTTPVKAGDLIVGSSVTAGSVALKPGEKPEVAWRDKGLNCYFSTPVLVGSHLYMVVSGGTITNPAIALKCVEGATGKVLWTKDRIGKYHAALVRTGDGKLLMLDDAGTLFLLQPDPAAYKELAKAKVCGPTWAHPALADGKLYVRDDKELICLDLK